REGFVRALLQPRFESLHDLLERPLRFFAIALPRVGADQSLIDFNGRAVTERVIHLAQEDQLLVQLGDGVVITALQVVEVAEPRMRADDLDALPAREELLLKLRRLARHLLAAFVFAQVGITLGELQRDPAGLRVDGERLLEFDGGFAELPLADEVSAAQRGAAAEIIRRESQRAADRADGLVFAA